jgi:hypothetical protein
VKPQGDVAATGHTPGPWRIGATLWTQDTKRYTPQQRELNDAGERRCVFANFHENDGGRSRILIARGIEEEANARLIALAPEMLDLLREVMESREAKGYVGIALLADIRATIAKAEGVQ